MTARPYRVLVVEDEQLTAETYVAHLDRLPGFEVAAVAGSLLAARQAAAAGHAAIEEMLLLTTHGILHLLGYDHAEPDEEKEMFELQRQLLLTFLAGRGREAKG